MSTITDQPMQAQRPIFSTTFKAEAVLVGERIDLRSFTAREALATNPLTIAIAGGAMTLYRHGVLVFFDVPQAGQAEILRDLLPMINGAYSAPETESLDIHVEASGREGVTAGLASLETASVERLQIIARHSRR